VWRDCRVGQAVVVFPTELVLSTWAQIRRYCPKIYPKMCHKIILRQLWCRKIILWHILG